MYQAKLYIDFDWAGVLDEVTSEFDEPFDVPAQEVHDDETITFVIDTRGHQDVFVERMRDAPEVTELERLDESNLLVGKEAKGASGVIRENHGKLNGVDRVHGTKRVFEVVLLRRSDLRSMVSGLRDLGDVRLGRLVEMTGRPGPLTDRQYEAVRTALEAGYFEWPRETDADGLAEALDVSRPTALEHLRKGEQKLLERALADVTARTTRQDREFLVDYRTVSA